MMTTERQEMHSEEMRWIKGNLIALLTIFAGTIAWGVTIESGLNNLQSEIDVLQSSAETRAAEIRDEGLTKAREIQDEVARMRAVWEQDRTRITLTETALARVEERLRAMEVRQDERQQALLAAIARLEEAINRNARRSDPAPRRFPQ